MKNNRIKIPALIIVLTATALSLYFISRARSFQFLGEIHAATKTQHKFVALTFDDGPTAKTDTVLRILEKHQVKATFFLIGQDIENHPQEAGKIVLGGHELGNHSYSHKRMIFKTSGFVKTEIEKTDSLIRRAGYTGPIHFRPPYGKKLFLLPYYLAVNNRVTIMWNVEPESYPAIAGHPDEIAKYVIEQTGNGSIILLHVMSADSNTSISALENIITGLKSKGYAFKTISALLTDEQQQASQPGAAQAAALAGN